METLKFEQIKELQEHQAIKHGGWKLAVAMLIFFGALFTLATAGYWMIHGRGVDRGKDALLALAITIFVMPSAGILVYHHPISWLRDYWRRNVRGYVARFWLSDTGSIQYTIVPRTEDEKDRTPRYATNRRLFSIAVSLPLNGRTTRPWLAFADKVSDSIIESRLKGWSVRLRAIFETGAVMVEIRKHNCFWGVDEHIVTDIGSALRYLEEIATTAGSASSSVSDFMHWMSIKLDVTTRECKEALAKLNEYATLKQELASAQEMRGHFSRECAARDRRMTVLHQLIAAAYHYDPSMPARPVADVVEDNLRHLIAERDAARGEVDRYKDGFLPAAIADRDAARKKHAEAIVFVTGLAQEVETTDRLFGTIAGLRLLDRMLNWLCQSAVQDTPEHRALQDRLAVVRAKLVEKERRERTRHGRTKPAAPAAT